MNRFLSVAAGLLLAGSASAKVFNTPTINSNYVYPAVAGNNIDSSLHGGDAGARYAADEFCDNKGYSRSGAYQFADYGWQGSSTPYSMRYTEEWSNGNLRRFWSPIQTGIRFNYVECL